MVLDWIIKAYHCELKSHTPFYLHETDILGAIIGKNIDQTWLCDWNAFLRMIFHRLTSAQQIILQLSSK